LGADCRGNIYRQGLWAEKLLDQPHGPGIAITLASIRSNRCYDNQYYIGYQKSWKQDKTNQNKA
tara:strand:- start:723 stop:914 length:192 start_codon:yes stop_codon:yes gene_type:complete